MNVVQCTNPLQVYKLSCIFETALSDLRVSVCCLLSALNMFIVQVHFLFSFGWMRVSITNELGLCDL